MKMPIPDDWDGTSFCRYAVCWPDSVKWRGILRGLITEPGRGYFWDEYTGSINTTLALFRETLTYNLDLKEVIMACEDHALTEIADALRQIAAVMQQQVTVQAGCCAGSGGGSGGAGQHSPPFNPTEIIDPGTGDPPEGFESWEKYYTNKCAVATDIVNNLIASWNRMSTINLVGLTLLSLTPILIGLLLDPVPGDEIAVIGGVLLTTLGVGTVLIDKVIDTLNNHKDELICILYNASSAENATSEFATAFGDFWTSDGNDSLMGYSARTAIAAMVGSSSTNRLFTLETNRTLPEGDCSTCEACVPDLELVLGSGDITLNGESRVLTSEASEGGYFIRIQNNSDPCCEYFVQFDDKTDSPFFEIVVGRCDLAAVYIVNDPIPSGDPGENVFGNLADFNGLLSIGSFSPFTVTVTLDTAH